MIRKSAASFLLLAAPFGACTFKTVTPIEPAPEVIATEVFEQVENTAVRVLFVVDNSGSMAQEQQNLKANVAKFVDVIAATGADAQFAVVTSDVDLNPKGSFLSLTPPNAGRPDDNIVNDVKLANGTIIQEIPNASGGADNNSFCNDVINASALTQRGILDLSDVALQGVIDSAGLIPDFNGRENGAFIDANNDKVADNNVTAIFADAVGCIISAGIKGSGQECHLCGLAAALDADSLANENAGFFDVADDPLLAVIFLADEDDGTDGGSILNGDEFQCRPLSLAGSPIGGLLSATSETNVCGTGVNGQFDALEDVQTFADQLLAIRPDNKIFVASISGPPGAVIADCENDFPVPACNNAFSGSASPGNRLFQFTQNFTNKFDALDIEAGICNPEFGDVIADIANQIGALLNAGCLNEIPQQLDNGDFQVRVVFDLSEIPGATCDTAISTAINGTTNVCLLNADQVIVEASQPGVCVSNFQVRFAFGAAPTGAKVNIQYVAVPQ